MWSLRRSPCEAARSSGRACEVTARHCVPALDCHDRFQRAATGRRRLRVSDTVFVCSLKPRHVSSGAGPATFPGAYAQGRLLFPISPTREQGWKRPHSPGSIRFPSPTKKGCNPDLEPNYFCRFQADPRPILRERSPPPPRPSQHPIIGVTRRWPLEL